MTTIHPTRRLTSAVPPTLETPTDPRAIVLTDTCPTGVLDRVHVADDA
ncbi:hypothetical protein [Methylobacterium sp. WL116]|nr:hypothetical protein [Methylobacterium sp. WL116]